MLCSYLILCRLLFPLSLVFPSIRVFSNESALHIWWPKDWSFNFSNCPSNEYSGSISLRIDWFDHLAVQGTLKSLLWHQNLKASIPWCSAFFIVQLSHSYMTTGKAIALTIYGPLSAKWCLCFLTCYLGVCHSFPSKEQESFRFMAALIIHSDFRVQENNFQGLSVNSYSNKMYC